MIPQNQLIEQIKPTLKAMGFKKHNKTWVLNNKDTAIVFNIQNSQFGDLYYINVGTYIREIGNTKTPSISSCQVWNRIDANFQTSNQVVDTISLWIEWYGDLKKIRERIRENKMPRTTHQSVFRYFLFGHDDSV